MKFLRISLKPSCGSGTGALRQFARLNIERINKEFEKCRLNWLILKSSETFNRIRKNSKNSDNFKRIPILIIIFWICPNVSKFVEISSKVDQFHKIGPKTNKNEIYCKLIDCFFDFGTIWTTLLILSRNDWHPTLSQPSDYQFFHLLEFVSCGWSFFAITARR